MDWLVPACAGCLVGVIIGIVLPEITGSKRKCRLTLTVQDDLEEDVRDVTWEGTARVAMSGVALPPTVFAVSLQKRIAEQEPGGPGTAAGTGPQEE
jgi:hypothetical protein